MKKIGIIIADECEFAQLRNKTDLDGYKISECRGVERLDFSIGGSAGTALRSGIGLINAAAAAAYLIASGVDIIINTGYSGGIYGVKKGMLTFADKFVQHDFDLSPLGYEKTVKPDGDYVYYADEKLNAVIKNLFPCAVEGTMVSGDCFVGSESLRKSLRSQFDAVSCDMETSAIASVCHKAKVPFASLRKISDNASDNANELYCDTVETDDSALADVILKVAEHC